MSKYQLILFAGECDNFIGKLRDLGMVDITTSGWEPSAADRDLILEIESQSKAESNLVAFAQSEVFDATATAYSSSSEAIDGYNATCEKIAEYDSQIEQLEKIKEEATPWGEFSSNVLEGLASEGVKLAYHIAKKSIFDEFKATRGADLTIAPINISDDKVYFVVVSREGEQVEMDIDAQSVRPLTLSVADAKAQIKEIELSKSELNGDMSRAVVSLPLIIEGKTSLIEKLQNSRVSNSAESAAEGSLLVMEAWAEEEKAKEVDALLESQSGLVYIKSNPTMEDDTPVKLKNGWYSQLFEMIGNLYSLPKYGTLDLTPFFAPFYMLFFAICLCDAGYGAVILAAGIALYYKGGDKMRQPAWFTIVCGTAAVIFGLLANSIFGVEFTDKPVIDFQTDFFTASMAIGVVQILFGMIINIVVTTKAYSFKHALGSVGWFIMIFSSVVAGGLGAAGVSVFGFDSIPYYIVMGIGFAILLLFNSPDKNIFANIGSGLWETYDRLTGLMSDVLSYIRLFAIGLSGGVLALVFNDLAIGMTGLDGNWDEMSVVSLVIKIVMASIILLAGHGINLFMSTITAFVHPMRLTFVEFYKNAGFQMSTRKFEPLKRGNE
ncbi:MAG: V-type ATPase 116kDa subunit family protein [Rikenellaceae bacterium]